MSRLAPPWGDLVKEEQHKCAWEPETCGFTSSALPHALLEVSPHLRGYAARHRGMLEGDLHKELANCRLVALKAVSNATVN